MEIERKLFDLVRTSSLKPGQENAIIELVHDLVAHRKGIERKSERLVKELTLEHEDVKRYERIGSLHSRTLHVCVYVCKHACVIYNILIY